jgi:hypothetical protein
MELTSVDFYKICGIFFLIGMCWYFVFVVFKTNKDFLYSISKPKDNTSSLDDLKSLFGSNSLIEGFKEGMKGEQDEERNKFEIQLEKETKAMEFIDNFVHLGENGKASNRKLILKILKQRRELYRKYGYLIGITDTQPEKVLPILKLREFYEKIPDEYEKAMADGEW